VEGGFGFGTNWLGDDDLNLLSPNPNTFNATVIEFQFIPSVSEVNFNYVFASNEYPDFVCNFSDIFAFILSGPGISDSNFYDLDGNPGTPDEEINVGGINLALLPTTNVPVSITNVHTNENCFPTEAGAFAFPEFFDVGNVSSGYGGMTVPLSVTASVTPGETYTIKLAIADFNDASFDSAVFLEGSSLVFEIPEVNDVFECDAYVLPEADIGEYFSEPLGQGNVLAPGTEITETTTVYLFNTDSNSCFEDFDETSFEVNIYNLDDADQLEDVTACDSFILPSLINGNYFTEPN
jgi:hypothetical protein